MESNTRGKAAQQSRNCFLVVTIIASATAASARPRRGIGRAPVQQTANVVMTIHVYNDAKASPGVLGRTEAISASVFHQAGVQIRWVDEDVSPEKGREARPFSCADIGIHIAPQFMVQSLGQEGDALGVAPGRGPNRRLVYVFYGRAEQLVQQHRTELMKEALVGRFFYPSPTLAQFLGYAIAHELGHVLGLDFHSPTGIMRADWNLADVRKEPYGELGFTRLQAETIRAAVRRRLLEIPRCAAPSWWPPMDLK